MKKNFGRIITIVGLVAIVAAFVISVIQFCVRGIAINWAPLTMIACCYTCIVASSAAVNKKKAK